jgi:hypothetical protein
MDVSRNSMLGELASDAASERTDFLVQATEQLAKFLDRNRGRIADIGGMTLIDEDPDYLSVAPDGTFRVRSRFEDPDTGEWVTETEIVETASELVELYNPVEVYTAFAEAAREAAGLDAQPTAADDLMETAGVPPEETFGLNDDAAYAGAADEWAAGQPVVGDVSDDESAAAAMYNLALDFQERSQANEASLIDQFQDAVSRLSGTLGDLIIVDDEDERLTLTMSGHFRAEVIPEEGAGEWRELVQPEDIVEYYDPTDVFGDLADALAESFPSVAPGAEAGEDDMGDEDDDEDDADQGEDDGELEDESDAPPEGTR